MARSIQNTSKKQDIFLKSGMVLIKRDFPPEMTPMIMVPFFPLKIPPVVSNQKYY